LQLFVTRLIISPSPRNCTKRTRPENRDNMQIALMSDSHDNLPILHRAVKWCNDNMIDHVLHAGDLIAPFMNRALDNLRMPLTIVFGNNDGERHGLSVMFQNKIFAPPYEILLDNKKIVLLHEPDPMDQLNLADYDLILYGHTHSIDIRKGKPLIVNPGELGGWLSGRATFAVWDTNLDKITIIDITP